MRISEIRGDAALDFIADIIEPASVIFGDDEITNLIKPDKDEPVKKTRLMTAAKAILKRHRNEAKEILAALEGVSVEEYKANPIQILAQVFMFLIDASGDITTVFFSQERKTGNASSGDVTENITETVT